MLIRCTFEEGLGDGSGWIAERHGNEAYVVTNSHVVGMDKPAKPPPEKISVILNSGLGEDERTFEGKLLAIDREDDLAVIRIKGHDLPPAFKITPSFDLQESQRLQIIGFPHGKFLERELRQGLGVNVTTTVSTRETSVSRRILNNDGSVKYIQVEGGADHGNSGGPVIDTNGNVVAVLVAGIPGTNIRFVIPSEYVIHLLQGRILKVMPGQAVLSGGGIKETLTAMVADPLKRLRAVEADVFVGRKPDRAKGEKPIRPAPEKQPKTQEGDGPRSTFSFPYDTNQQVQLGEAYTVHGEASLPILGDNQVYWFQPHFSMKDGKERWGEAVVLEMGRFPVDAKPAHLAIQPKPDFTPGPARRVELESRQVLGFETEVGGGGGGELGLNVSLGEKTRSVEKNGDAKVRLQYLDLHLSDTDQDSMIRRQARGILETVKGLGVEVTLTKDGRFVDPKPDFANVPVAARPLLRNFNDQVINSLEAMTLGLPGKDVQPGESWTIDTHYTIQVARGVQNAVFRVTCTYVGTRVRDGKEEAVIDMTGRIVKNDNGSGSAGGRTIGARDNRGGSSGDTGGDAGGDDNSPYDADGNLKKGFFGVMHGAAVVDVATGAVTLARTESDMAVVFPVTVHNPRTNQDLEIKVHAGVYLEVLMRRSLTKDPPKPADPFVLLPNQPVTYNPLVGAAPPTDDATEGATENVLPQRNTSMPREIADRVKRAAVLIKVQTAEGGEDGSGWFAAPGLVVTNCHVVGMLSRTDRPPLSIEVVLDAGTGTERKLSGELLAVNRQDDLAVLRVKGDNLPEPLKVVRSDTLVESQPLTVVGFPLGSGMAKGLGLGLGARDLVAQVGLRSTAVTRQVLNKVDETVKYIQLEGGVDQGNSGGPVVDEKGQVRCVTVAEAPDTNLKFAIPSEYVSRMLDGYPFEVIPGRAYMDGSTPKQPVDVRFADPLGRVSAVHLDYWVGNPGKPRKPAEKTPTPADGDGKRESIELKFRPGVRPGERLASGEFVFPDPGPGRVLYLQPRFVNGTGAEQWSNGVVYAPDGPPVERKPALLAINYKLGSARDVDMTTLSHMHYVLFGQEMQIGSPFKVSLKERVIGRSKGTTTLNLEYKELEFDLRKILPGIEQVPQLESALHQALKPFLSLIRGVITVVRVKSDGRMQLAGVNYAQLPAPVQPQMLLFNSQILSSLQALTFPVPGKEVPYGYTWDFPTDLFIASKNRPQGAMFKMHFKYIGMRERAGRPEAVIEITGSLANNPNAKIEAPSDSTAQPVPADPDKPVEPMAAMLDQYAPPKVGESTGAKGLYGVAHGFAFLDLRDGFVAQVNLFIDLDAEVKVKDPQSKQEVPVVAGGTMELSLTRRTAQTR
ncbi:MAG TPA: trypsin-like peptidase domain-containing protein [Gemmataceae bacterium]|nr:trypsin-like peptidase domain-containing protein [Gemmataceae bacterium]